MRRRRPLKIKLNPFKKPTRKQKTNPLFSLRDQANNPAWSRRYDTIRFPQY